MVHPKKQVKGPPPNNHLTRNHFLNKSHLLAEYLLCNALHGFLSSNCSNWLRLNEIYLLSEIRAFIKKLYTFKGTVVYNSSSFVYLRSFIHRICLILTCKVIFRFWSYPIWHKNFQTLRVFYITYHSLKLTTYHVYGNTNCLFYVDQIVSLSKCFQ